MRNNMLIMPLFMTGNNKTIWDYPEEERNKYIFCLLLFVCIALLCVAIYYFIKYLRKKRGNKNERLS